MIYFNKFTLIIPTRERCSTLKSTIASCLNQTYNNYEIIISDNFSQDNTKDVVKSFNDSRIKYINTGKRVSMSENFEYALSFVNEGFLMFIGDDDAILPNSLEYVNEIINLTNCEAIVSYNAFYTWPETDNPNKLFWTPKVGYEIRDSKLWINKYLKFNMEYTFDLPSIYCGFVKKNILIKVSKDNIFFKSSTPDAYSAIAVAFATDKYIYSHTPFVIHGTSKNSNGGSYLSKSKNEEGNETKLWFKENKIPLHKDIVMTKSFRVSSIEAFLQFSDNFPELTRNYKINWERLLRFVLKECKDNTRDEIESAVKEMCIYHNVNFQKIINNVPNKFTGVSFDEIVIRLLNKIKNVIQNKTITINDTKNFGVNNVFEASLLLNFFLNTKRNHKDF